MAISELDNTHGTVSLPPETAARRSVRILRTLAEVNSAWSKAELPGTAEIVAAPEGRGTDVTVELDKDAGKKAEHALSPYEGGDIDQRLESALRDFKAKLETGEVATIEGQSSGRND